ncbi:hypothetical protein GCM10027174_45860 [Salinifilum aidingensis]
MSTATDWREQRRADKHAAAQAQATLLAAQAEQDRADRQAADERRRHEVEHRRQLREQRRQARRDAWAARTRQVRAWLAEHAGDVLIYQLAVVAAVMAMPAMAAWGLEQYGMATGLLLPVITELGMWSFSIAARIHTRRNPNGSVWALLCGVAVFSAVAAGTNFLHGYAMPGGGIIRGLVMAIVSVSGVAAHQLATARRPRPRIERQHTRRVRRFEKAALSRSVARVDHTGAVELLAPAGTYRLSRLRRLRPAAVPGLPVAPVDDLDRELAHLATESHTAAGKDTASDAAHVGETGGGVGTVDPPESSPSISEGESRADLQESRFGRGAQNGTGAGVEGPSRGGRPTRSFEQLRADFDRLLAADPTAVDVTSAESIRRALGCGAKSARRLRDEHTQS